MKLKKLAEQTQESTVEISKILETILNKTKEVSEETTESKKQIDSGYELAKLVTEVFNSVNGYANVVSDKNDIVQLKLAGLLDSVKDIYDETMHVSTASEKSHSNIYEISGQLNGMFDTVINDSKELNDKMSELFNKQTND